MFAKNEEYKRLPPKTERSWFKTDPAAIGYC